MSNKVALLLNTETGLDYSPIFALDSERGVNVYGECLFVFYENRKVHVDIRVNVIENGDECKDTWRWDPTTD